MDIDDGALIEDDLELPPGEEPDLSVEDRARLRGWKPLEEYRGNPEHWRSAEEFMRVGQEDAAVLREENRRLEKRVHRLDTQIRELHLTATAQLEALREMRQIAARNDQRGYDRAQAELHEQRAAAVEAGDRDAFAQVEERIKALGERPADPPPAPPPPPPGDSAVDPDVLQFLKDNASWYKPEEPVGRAMIAHYDIVARRNPDWPVQDVLEEAKARTARDYPERFTDMGRAPEPDPPPPPPSRRQANSVQRGAFTPPPARQPRQAAGWDQIADSQERVQAKASFDRQKRADPELTEGEFLQIYLDPHIDVLALRAQRKKA